jgi:hypothetical protein
MCNLASGYLLLGATTREVVPDAVMAVQNSKFTLIYHGHPSAGQIAATSSRDIAKADRERAAFIAAMGISHERDDLIRTVEFQNPHALARSGLDRFSIDTVDGGNRVDPANCGPSVNPPNGARERSLTMCRFERWNGGCSTRTRIAPG